MIFWSVVWTAAVLGCAADFKLERCQRGRAGGEALGNGRMVRGLEAGQAVSRQGSVSFGGRSAFGFSVEARICRLAFNCYRR